MSSLFGLKREKSSATHRDSDFEWRGLDAPGSVVGTLAMGAFPPYNRDYLRAESACQGVSGAILS